VTAWPNPNETLRELLAALAADPTSEGLWSALYKHIYPYVFAVAFRAVRGSKESAKDATQVVFLRLFQYCEFTEFFEPEEFLGYVATIARHAALDMNKAEGKYVTGLDLTLCDFLPGGPTPQQHEQARKTLTDVLEYLGPEERQLVNLLVEGLSLEEIARQLGISYANAAVRIHRLRARISKRLKTKEI
jgi:RNA polymerase sigma factor (sigma-70 family)